MKKTIIGNLHKNCICRIKRKNWSGYVMPIKENIFQKLDNFKLENINKRKFIRLKKKDFQIPFEINNIIGIGKNFSEDKNIKLVQNFKKNPDFFIMGRNSLISSNKKINLPKCYGSVLVEGEVGVVIKKKCKNLSPKQVKNYILGYVICNDLSGRDLKNLNNDNVLLRKSSDNFLPIGPAIKIGHQKSNFEIKTFINLKLIQVSNSRQLIISIDNIISLLSKYITLNKFDLICTGSGLPKPKARKNDNVKIAINNLGELNSRI